LYTENLTTQTEPIVENNCQEGYGRLPGDCGSLAFPYVPAQLNSNKRYANRQALQNGTLFPGLNLPFKYGAEKPGKLSDSELHELMAMDFAIDELGLYLTTHSEDREALALYWSYIRMAREARKKYEAENGPLFQTDITEGGFKWLNDPWPWEEGGNS